MPNPAGNFLGLLGSFGDGNNIFNNMAAGVSPAQSLAQTARQQFQIGQQNFAAQVQGLLGRGIPIDQAIAIVSDPNGPAAQMQYGPPKQYQPPEITENSYKPAGAIYGPNGFQQIPTNTPQPVGTAIPQNAGGTNLPAATPGVGGPATAGIPGIPPNVAATMEGLRQRKVQTEGELARAKTVGEEQGTTAANLEGITGQIQRSIKLIDELAADPNKQYATGYYANLDKLGLGGALSGSQTYGWVKKLDQLKEQLTLDLLPTLQKGRMSPAYLELLQKSTAGQELDRGNPNFDEGLKNTRDALTQILGAVQHKAGVAGAPPPEAINMLKKDPKLKNQFEAKYGPGSAAAALGQ